MWAERNCAVRTDTAVRGEGRRKDPSFFFEGGRRKWQWWEEEEEENRKGFSAKSRFYCLWEEGGGEPRWATGGRDPLLFRTCEMAHISHIPRDVCFLWEMFGFVHLDIRPCQLVWAALARVQHLEAKNHSQILLRSSFFRLPRCLSRGEGRRK